MIFRKNLSKSSNFIVEVPKLLFQIIINQIDSSIESSLERLDLLFYSDIQISRATLFDYIYRIQVGL